IAPGCFYRPVCRGEGLADGPGPTVWVDRLGRSCGRAVWAGLGAGRSSRQQSAIERAKARVDPLSKTPLLDLVVTPDDLRRLPERQLRQLADELRQETIDAVAVTGGHLGAGLGVVELTVALHWIFDTPRDRLIWDVGHQAYPHKIL